MLFALVAAAAAAPLSLDDAVAAARSHAPEAAVLDARLDQARGDAGAARAALFPQVGATAGYRRNDKEIGFPNPFDPTGQSTLTIQKLDVVTASATASQVVFNAALFGRVIAAGHLAEGAEALHDGGALDLSVRVATLWLGARAAGEQRVATRDALVAAESHARVAASALAAGTATPLTVDRAKLAVLDAHQRLLDAERSEADLLGQLAQLVGDPDVTVLPGPLVAADEGGATDDATVVALALRARPELLAARAQLAAAEAGRWTVAGAWAPAISAAAAYSYSSSPMFTDEPTSWYVGVNASLPVFDGGLRFAEARRASAAIDAARATLERLEASTAEEARSALRAERSATQALELARTQEELARHALGIAESAFAVGGGTAVDVEDAQAAVLSAQVGRIRAEAAFLGARWQRRRLCGEAVG